MFDGWAERKVLKITDDEMAYTCYPDNWGSDAAASEVHYKLLGVAHGTEVIVTHTGTPTKDETESHRTGWDKNFFKLIGQYLANRNQS